MQFRTFAIAAALAAAPLTGASAEPQILGLLAQSEPLTLNCSGGECFAEFSSFCMEPDRDSPSHETAYQPFDEADLTLVASTPTGEKRLSARDLASFISVRGYAAVRVSVPETVLADLGASSVALAVGRHVALMPTADPKYRRPHESQEIALAKGPRRLAGERIVDQGGDKAAAARVLGRLINGLPERGPINPAAREALWDQRIEVAGRDWVFDAAMPGTPARLSDLASQQSVLGQCGRKLSARRSRKKPAGEGGPGSSDRNLAHGLTPFRRARDGR
jgi:hypothetical protein